MNCKTCQRELLSLPDPASPPFEIAAHLATCATCRAVADGLETIEQNVPRLPVPVSERKQAVMAFFTQTPVATPEPVAASTHVASRWPVLRRWGLVAAAAGILIALGLWLGEWAARRMRSDAPVAERGVEDKKKDPAEKSTPRDKEDAAPEKALAVAVLEHDLELADTSDPARRVEALAKLTRTLSDESRFLTGLAAKKELATLARLHGKVLKEGLLPRARALPMDARRKTLEPIAVRLEESHESLKGLADKAGATATPLTEMAATSASAALLLRELMDEAAP